MLLYNEWWGQHVFMTFSQGISQVFLVVYLFYYFDCFLYVTELKREFLRQVWVGYNLQTGFQ